MVLIWLLTTGDHYNKFDCLYICIQYLAYCLSAMNQLICYIIRMNGYRRKIENENYNSFNTFKISLYFVFLLVK